MISICDGVEQVGLAQTGGAVDEQRVVGAGGVGRNGLGRGVGKLVGRPLDEVFEGEVIPAGGQFILGGGHGSLFRLGLRHHELHLDVKAQHRLEGFLQQSGVPVGDDLTDKVIAHREGDAVGVFKADGLESADVILISGVRRVDPAVFLGRVQNVVERVHCIPHFITEFCT